MGALVLARTGASAFPYMREFETCRQRLIAQNVSEPKPFFRRAKCQEAPSWPCLPIPQVISQGFSRESRLAYDDANHRK